MRSLSYQPGTPHSAGGMLSPALLTVSTLSRHKDTSGACCRRNWKGSRPGLPLQSDTPGLRHGVPSECTREHMPRLRGQRTPARPMAARGPPLATPSLPRAGPDSAPGPPQVLPRQTTSPQEPTLERGSAGVRGAKTCPCFAPFAFSLSGLDSVQRGLCQFKAGWRRCGPSTLCKALPHIRVKTTCHQSCLATS